MKKLSKKELSDYFSSMCLFLANHHWTERDERAVAIREMLKRPGVTEEWIEEKTDEAYNLLYYETFNRNQVKDFIRSLVEELSNEVDKEMK